MAAAAGEYVGELPEPVTRPEFYWQKIAQRIDAGSSVSPESIDAAIEDYINTHDADIVTEAELSDALSGKANASHTHTQSEVTGLETALSSKADASHTHDDRYYTETEIDTALAGKQATLTSGDNITIATVNGVLTISADTPAPTDVQVQTAVDNYLDENSVVFNTSAEIIFPPPISGLAMLTTLPTQTSLFQPPHRRRLTENRMF